MKTLKNKIRCTIPGLPVRSRRRF